MFRKLIRLFVKPELLLAHTTSPTEYKSLLTYLVTGDQGFKAPVYFALESLRGVPSVRFDFYDGRDVKTFVQAMRKHKVKWRFFGSSDSVYISITELEDRGMMPPFTCVPLVTVHN